MNSKTTIISCVISSVALLSGCGSTADSGKVTAAETPAEWKNGPAVGLTAAEVKFTTPKKESRLFAPADGWVTVIGFLGSRKDCCELAPELVETADRFFSSPVRVIQVALPTKKCPYGAGCIECNHVHAKHLMAISDPKKIAYRAFGTPKENTVLLLDREGVVKLISSLDNINKMYPSIENAVVDALQHSIPGYADIYTD